jgi:hypothetical protein
VLALAFANLHFQKNTLKAYDFCDRGNARRCVVPLDAYKSLLKSKQKKIFYSFKNLKISNKK